MKSKALGWEKCFDEFDLRRSTQFSPCVRSPLTQTPHASPGRWRAGSIGDERLLLLRLSLPFCFSDAFLMMPGAVLRQAEAYPPRLSVKLNLP